MEIQTTHEIWLKHYHNGSEPEGQIPCSKKWVSVEDLKKWINEKCISEDTQEVYAPHLLKELGE